MWKDRRDTINKKQIIVNCILSLIPFLFWVLLFRWDKTWAIIIFISCILIIMIAAILGKNFKQQI